MKRLVLYLLMLASLTTAAQTITGGSLPPIRPIEKTVYDSALIRVYYEYRYRPDPNNTGKWRKAQTIMLIGDRYTGFADYTQIREDSLNDAYYREKRSPMELVSAVLTASGSGTYDSPLVVDIARNTATVQISGQINCQYTQNLKPAEWTLADGDTTICGIKCRKATCRMGGRDWTAWYSEDYAMPYGPYLFRGLPGLIFAISDTGCNHVFTLNGIVRLAVPQPIYLYKDNQQLVLSREDALKMKRNEAADPQSAMEMSGKSVTFIGEKRLKSLPYNPIELE